jgi:hypothetical protein
MIFCSFSSLFSAGGGGGVAAAGGAALPLRVGEALWFASSRGGGLGVRALSPSPSITPDFFLPFFAMSDKAIAVKSQTA